MGAKYSTTIQDREDYSGYRLLQFPLKGATITFKGNNHNKAIFI